MLNFVHIYSPPEEGTDLSEELELIAMTLFFTYSKLTIERITNDNRIFDNEKVNRSGRINIQHGWQDQSMLVS